MQKYWKEKISSRLVFIGLENSLRIKTIKKSKDELKLEIEGEGHTFCNLLQNTLVEDRSVTNAGYDTPHPLTEKSIIYIKVKKESSKPLLVVVYTSILQLSTFLYQKLKLLSSGLVA